MECKHKSSNKHKNQCCIGSRGLRGPTSQTGSTGSTGNSSPFIIIDCDTCNTFVGCSAGISITTGINNSGFGGHALEHNTSGNNNSAIGCMALQNNMTGERNSSLGTQALNANIIGNDNTAIGFNALSDNLASANTALGSFALQNSTSAINNTAIGVQSMQSTTTGSRNTAVGLQSMQFNTIGEQNVAVGGGALSFNISGNNNTALGRRSLLVNSTGDNNTAVGHEALLNNTGNNNIAVGLNAGNALITGNNNIDIGNVGIAAESNTIRIGTTQINNFQAGIFGQPAVNSTVVLVTATGKLGTLPSSEKYKHNIQNINESEAIFELEPVSFIYIPDIDITQQKQYGFIAEAVEKKFPNPVIRDINNEIVGIKNEHIVPLILNELIKEHETIKVLKFEIELMKIEMENI